MELLSVVHAETGEPTGLIVPRAEAIERGTWCRSTNVYLINAKGELLCHQRSLHKERLPGVWSTHLGGHVGAHETFESNAAKELAEEAGVPEGSLRLHPWRTTSLAQAKLWVREFVAFCDLPTGAFTPQPGEVEAFSWHSLEDILRRKTEEPAQWCAGTHDLALEYWCMRAALEAAQHVDFRLIPHHLGIWGHAAPTLSGAS